MAPASPPQKRVKLSNSGPDPAVLRLQRAAFLSSLSRPVSPPIAHSNTEPPTRIDSTTETDQESSDKRFEVLLDSQGLQDPEIQPTLAGVPSKQALRNGSKREAVRLRTPTSPLTQAMGTGAKLLPSPFRLTHIRDLPESANVDTVHLKDFLGDPLIKEAWIFNYCFDVDWIMQHFDPDVRDLVAVKIVHGSWKNEDSNKIRIDEACRRYRNVRSLIAYLPDAFGTHHTKMLVVLRHDDLAQIVIHTANMLPGDWCNMTQAAWCSPMLPTRKAEAETILGERCEIGSGKRFQQDLIAYLDAYGRGKLNSLMESLKKHDFSAVRGALIGSVPSKTAPSMEANAKVWGHVALKRALRAVYKGSLDKEKAKTTSVVLCQVSSIASFSKDWLYDTLFGALAPTLSPRFHVLFPTPDEVRLSLDGYGCGGSIHCKTHSTAHQKQIDVLSPHLCHWATPLRSVSPTTKHANRGRAAPHIKTYIRLSSSEQQTIEWALLTSANLSMQAWGSAPKMPSKKERDEGLKGPIVHIQSYELGVLVWPDLFADDGTETLKMVPVFGQDTPHVTLGPAIGLRMPYDLPVVPYATGEQPWSPNIRYDEPDTHGCVWPIQLEE